MAHSHQHESTKTSAPIEPSRLEYAALRNDAGFHPDDLSRFRFERVDAAAMAHISNEFAIEYREQDQFTVLVPPWRKDVLLDLAPQAELIDDKINPWIYSASYDYLQGYRDYNQVKSTFETWEQSYPNLIAMQDFPYMKSQNGKPLLVAKITKDAQKDHPKRPNIVITAATHGDEHLACESLLVNLEKLLKGYESNDRFKKMIDRANIYIVPIVSPDSFLRSRNVHGVDPNRVYDYPGKSSPQTSLKSAVSMIKFYQEIEPAGALDFHGAPPNGMIMYPWGYTSKAIEDSEDRARHDRVAKKMGQTTPGYAVGPIYSTIYPAKGGTVDHNYMHHDMLAIVIEIGGGRKSPPISQIPGKAKEIEEATWIFVESLIPEGSGDDDDENEDSGDSGSEDSAEDSDSQDDSGDTQEDSTTSETEDSPSEDDKNSDDEDEDESDEDEDESDEDQGTSDDSESNEDGSDAGANSKGSKKGCTIQGSQAPSALALFGLAAFGLRRRRRHRMRN